MPVLTFLFPLFGLLALGFAVWRARWVQQQPAGTERMAGIAKHIAEGARAFLQAEYRVVAVFVVSVAVVFLVAGLVSPSSNPLTALAFVVGAICSGLSAVFGMRTATRANVRCTEAARTGLGEALAVAFGGGSVIGLGVVGLGSLGLGLLFLVFGSVVGLDGNGVAEVMRIVTGFSFGASSIALFARVGGGIFTKAADVGADLVGKVEEGIPEDHPLNPATIADNVGDNVGDVAGMGADLFESYVGALVGAMVLGSVFVAAPAFEGEAVGLGAVLLPLALACLGIVSSMVACLSVKVRKGGNPHRALNLGAVLAAGLLIAGAFVVTPLLLPDRWEHDGEQYSALGVFAAVLLGLGAGMLIGFVTERSTCSGSGPVLEIVRQSRTGAGTNVIAGIGSGMFSTALPVIILAGTILLSHHFAGLYGIAIAAVGMLANTGVQLAIDAYGPIADNAGGIAEMSGLPPEVRERTDRLDAVGNTTAAIGKGFAIGSAALTSLALFAAFTASWEASNGRELVVVLTSPRVVAALMLGAMLPFVFSAFAMRAVGRAAMAMIEEVRRQFREIPELRAALDLRAGHGQEPVKDWPEQDRKVYEAAEGKAEYGRCVEISARSAIREMVRPALLAVVAPVVVGFLGGAVMLAGLLAGVTSCGVLLALFQSNAGGAWDNAKKMIEAGVDVDGEHLAKGSAAHMAAVVGDTVGDPFKDTSGPALNILLKLMAVVALVIAPMIG